MSSSTSQTDISTQHLLSLGSIRFRSSLLLENPDCLQNFDVDLSKLPQVAEEIVRLVKRDYKDPSLIPPHSRWRHFEAAPPSAASSTNEKKIIDRIGPLLKDWKAKGVDSLESVRRLLDLFVVGVLLDAGAGSAWHYSPKSEGSAVYNRSEGLGIAAFDLFCSGALSSSKDQPFQCDSKGLTSLTAATLSEAFQVSEKNPLVGLEGRCLLLQRLGKAVEEKPKYFMSSTTSIFRPGNLLDYLLSCSKNVDGKEVVNIKVLWSVVIDGFSGVWPPTRTFFEGTSLGDVWPSKALARISKLPSAPLSEFPGIEGFVCFHKLSQWLTYSLMEPLALANIVFEGVETMTGLAEYRNGGLFVDWEVIKLKPSVANLVPAGTIPRYEVWDDVVVEWRSLTVVLLDKVAELVREKLNMTAKELPLAKILEAGTWKAGREIAARLRPDTKGPPIEVISDGTVF